MPSTQLNGLQHPTRFIAVLQECTEKLQFLSAIAPDVLQHRDELTAFVGGEISRIITEQRDLENRYEELITERGALKGLSNKTKYKAVQSEIQDVSHALRNSTKSLCRNLKDNPNIAGNLVKIHRERTELIDVILGCISELESGGGGEGLRGKVEGDRKQQEYQKEIMRKERETALAVKQLDKDLTIERQDHAQIVTEQREEMVQLKEQLLSIRTRASVDVKFQRAEANAKTASILRSFKQKEAELEAEIRKYDEELKMEEIVHNETIEFLRKKQKGLGTENERWEKKNEEDLGVLTTKYNKLITERDANLEVLMHLKSRREKEIAEEVAKKEAEEAELLAEKMRVELEAKMNNAAGLIQAVAKMFMKRQKEKVAAGGGKKGKKPKKGKK